MTSIRRRLLVILLSLFMLAWLAFTLLSYVSARDDIEKVLDAELAQSARVLFALIQHEIEEEEEDPAELQADILGAGPNYRYGEKIAFQAWRQGRLLLRSPNAPTARMATDAGFNKTRIGDTQWRVFVLSDPRRSYEIHVGDRQSERDALILGLFSQTLIPVSVVLPLLAWLLWSGINRGLKPLHRVTQEIGVRNPQQLNPLEEGAAPDEVRPLIAALNRLLARLRATLEGERRFTANAAHELRTPLAGLKAQAQLAQRAHSDAERNHAVEQVLRSVERASHLVAQLLTLARVDPEIADARDEPVDLARLASLAAAEMMPLASDRDIALEFHADGVHELRGNPQMLAILLRNILDNAVRYTPRGGVVQVALARDGTAEVLTVTDSGPGIPAAQRDAVFERFVRLPDTAGSGCGLGLSIVRRIAELHRAEVMLDDAPNGRGLRVSVSFRL